jgi:putative toxin-antitoxin system antitoxin component (TIGR02293 family)
MSTTLKHITDLLGGAKTLGRSVRTSHELMQVARDGFPYAALEQVMHAMGLSREEIETVLALPARTLTRRKQAKHLHAVESDRLLRLARVAAHAISALGSTDKAAQWLHRPNRALGGEAPLQLMDTDFGAIQVDDILTRIEHGVIS